MRKCQPKVSTQSFKFPLIMDDSDNDNDDQLFKGLN